MSRAVVGGQTPSGIRVGDDERARAAERLAAHAAAGRLTVDELEERVGRAHAAVVRRDLDALEADLPSLAPAPWPPARLPVSLTVVVAVVVAVLAGTVAVALAVGHPVVPPLVFLAPLWLLIARRARWVR